MLNESQLKELEELALSLSALGQADAEIQAAIDARKAEMLNAAETEVEDEAMPQEQQVVPEVEVEEKAIGGFQYKGKNFTFDEIDEAAKKANLSFNDYIQKYGIATTDEVEVTGERDFKIQETEIPYTQQEEIVGPKTQSQVWQEKWKTDLLDYEENLIPEAEELFSSDWEEKNMATYYGVIPGREDGAVGGYRAPAVNKERNEAIEEAKKLLNEQNGGTNLVEPSEEEILETAKNIWLTKEQENAKSNFTDYYLRKNTTFDWSDPQTYASIVSKYIKAPLNPEMKAFKEREANLAKGDKKFAQEKVQKNKLDLNVLNDKIKANELQAINLAQGNYETQEDLDKAKKQLANIVLENEAIVKKSKDIFEDLQTNSKEIGKDDEYLDIINRDYSLSGIALGSLTASTIELVNGGLAIPRYLKTAAEKLASDISGNDYDIPDWMFSLASPAAALLVGDDSKKVNDYLGNISENIRGTFAKPQEVTEIDSILGGASWVAQLVGNQAPIMATMMAMPSSSLAMLGSSAAGSKFLEMEKDMNLPDGPSYSGLELLLAPAIVGGAEYLSERVTLGQIRGVMGAFKGNQTVTEAAKRYLTNGYLQWTKDLFREGGSEVAATLAENITDKYILDKDIELTRGLADSFASGAVMSGFIYKAPLAGRALTKMFWGEDVRNQIQTGNQLIKDLNNELNNDNLTKVERKEIENNITEIWEKQNKVMQNANERWDNATTAEKRRLFKIFDIQNNIRRKAQEIANNPKLSAENKKNNLDIQARKWDGYQDEKNSILTRMSEKNFDAQTFSMIEYENNVTRGKMGLNEYIDKQTQVLSNTLVDLQERRKKATAPEEIKLLDLKIKNVQDKIKYLVPEQAGFFSLAPKTIGKANSIKELNQAFITKSAELSDALKSKKITQAQYNSQYKRLKTIFDKKRNNIIGKVDKTKGEYTELQKLYDSTLDKEGKLPTTERARNKFVTELNRIGAPIFEKIAQRLYDPTPKNLLKEYSREDFIADLQSTNWELIAQEFDPSLQTLDKFISNRLNLRANAIIDKATGEGNQFTEELTDRISQTIIEDIEQENEANKIIETSKLLNLPKDITKKLKAGIPAILSTIKSKVDSRKFKGEISKAFKNLLYGDLKEFFGKDKKGDKRFTDFITKNTKALYDTLTEESMRMARNNKTGVNPFVEAGFLIEKDGELVKAPFENIDQQAFIDYYTAKDKAANTMSDRRMNLVEAVASSIGAAEAINVLTTNTDIKNRFLEQQTQELEKANKGLNLLVPKAFRGYIKTLKDLAQAKTINTVAKLLGIKDITVNNSNRAEKQKAVLGAIKKFGLTPNVFEAAMPASSGAVRIKVGANNSDAKKLALFLEKNNIKAKPNDYYYALTDGSWVKGVKKGNQIIAPQGVDNLVASRGRLYYGKSDPAYIETLKEAKKNLKGKEELKPKRVLNNFFSKDAQARSDSNMDILENVAIQLNDAVKAGMPKEIAALIIAQGYQATNGLIKIAAKFKYKSKVFEYGIYKFSKKNDKDRPFREEHNPPASVIGANLIWAISNDKVRDLMPYIRKNYYQTQLSKRDDERLDMAGLGGTLPQGSTILDNPIIRLAKAGKDGNRIDLNSIINPLTGKTLAQENNVESPNTIDGIAASNEAAIANNSDQVENLIDRAIAKLTELTGTEGTLQMNLGAIPVNLLIGGLRAVKLAYQGGKTLTQAIGAGYNKVKNYMTETEWAEFVGVSVQEIRNGKNPAQVKLAILSEKGVAQIQEQSRKTDNALLEEFGIEIDGLSTDQIVEKLNILRKAKSEASNPKNPTKKARVFDFDDTLAKTDSKVLYTLSLIHISEPTRPY